MVMSAGPFTMEPGDTQTVVVGIVVGHGADRFESIELMKANDRILQASFNNGFQWPWKPEFDARAGHDADPGRRLPETSEATPSEGGGLIIGSASQDRGWNVSVGPNPGRGMVTVRCHVPSPGHAEVQVFDTSGRVVHRAAIEGDPSGVSEWTWHGMTEYGTEMPPGIYFIRVRSGSRAETAKVIFIR
jgi:hypothetical protein